MAAKLIDAAARDLESHALPLAETNHAFLRRTTREWHERVDAAYAAYDLASRASLAAFLLRQAAALVPLERHIEACGAAAMLADWDRRSRRGAIEADLRDLGFALPAPMEVAEFPSKLRGFGALYVLEGSKLGGRVLLRTAAASLDPLVRSATRYLGHPNGGGWARFLAVLNDLPSSPEVRETLSTGAVAAFAAFLPDAARLSPDPVFRSRDLHSPALSIPVKHETARTHGEHAA